jgi:hypothetical protein
MKLEAKSRLLAAKPKDIQAAIDHLKQFLKLYPLKNAYVPYHNQGLKCVQTAGHLKDEAAAKAFAAKLKQSGYKAEDDPADDDEDARGWRFVKDRDIVTVNLNENDFDKRGPYVFVETLLSERRSV